MWEKAQNILFQATKKGSCGEKTNFIRFVEKMNEAEINEMVREVTGILRFKKQDSGSSLSWVNKEELRRNYVNACFFINLDVGFEQKLVTT